MNLRIAAATAALVLLAHPVAAQNPVVITVDAGHGGAQAGVQHDGTDEKDVVLRIAFTLAEELLARGYDAHLTRTRDVNIGLMDRLASAEAESAVMMISLHINGSDDSLRHGVEIYTSTDSERSANLSEHIANGLRQTGAPVAVLNRSHDFFNSPSEPVMMIELGFMTHPVEGRLMLSSQYHRTLARNIVDGIASHLEQRH